MGGKSFLQGPQEEDHVQPCRMSRQNTEGQRIHLADPFPGVINKLISPLSMLEEEILQINLIRSEVRNCRAVEKFLHMYIVANSFTRAPI